jgi:hypothetical protein
MASKTLNFGKNQAVCSVNRSFSMSILNTIYVTTLQFGVNKCNKKIRKYRKIPDDENFLFNLNIL